MQVDKTQISQFSSEFMLIMVTGFTLMEVWFRVLVFVYFEKGCKEYALL